MPTLTIRSNPAPRALGWSLLLHGLALCLAAAPFVRDGLASLAAAAASSLPPALPASPLEIEITVPAVTVVPPPQNPETFVRTDGLPEALPDPGKRRLISDRNTRASSLLPPDPTGLADQPSQEGIDVPAVEVIRRSQSDGEDESLPPSPSLAQSPSGASPPEPPAAAEAAPPAQATPPQPPPAASEKVAVADASDVAIQADDDPPTPSTAPPRPKTLRDEVPSIIREPAAETIPARPIAAKPPAPRPSPTSPASPPPGYSSLREPTKLRGTISNQGPASVDAQDTPVGRYMKQVTSAVEREWHRKRTLNRDFVTFGTIKLEFSVNARGQVEALSIKNRNGANSIMQDFTLNAVLDAKIPPMPAGLTDILDRDRLQISYDIIVY